jgi:hypothetical protein
MRFSIAHFTNDLRLRQYDARHPGEREAIRREAERLVQSSDASGLPLVQQAALIQMTTSHVKNALVKRLLIEAGVHRFSINHFNDLVTHGFAKRNIGKRDHDLTPLGLTAAKKLEQQICQRYSIHLLIDAGQAGWEQRYTCPCGQWSTRVRRSITSDSNAATQFNRHIRTVEGMSKLVAALKPPQMVEG